MARLAIGGEHRRASAGFQCVQRSQRTATVVGDDSRLRVDLANLGVPYIEQADEPFLPPDEIGTVRGTLLISISPSGSIISSAHALMASASVAEAALRTTLPIFLFTIAASGSGMVMFLVNLSPDAAS